MEGMYYLKFVKCAHEGTRRMKAEMRQVDLPAPEWRQEEIGKALVRVTLRNNEKQRRKWVDSDVAQLLGTQIASDLTEEEKRIINFCAENKKINVSDAQRITGRDWGTIKKVLLELEGKKILQHVHRHDILRDSKAHYVLRGMNNEERQNART